MSSLNGKRTPRDPAHEETQRLQPVAAPAGAPAVGVAHAEAAHAAPTSAIVPIPTAARPGGLSGSLADLRRRRYELAERVAELTWDLGGLTYEMAVRDHYRLDVLARRAAELQQADAELGEVQRMLAGAEAGVHGQCRSCGAVHSRGASFCWHCGAPLLEEARPAVLREAGDSR